MKLYEISEAMLDLKNMLDLEEEFTGVKDSLDLIEIDFAEKIDNIAKIITEFNGNIEILKNEEKRLASKRKIIESKVKNLKSYIEENMIKTEKKKIKTDLFSFNIQKNPSKLIIENEELLPKKYFKMLEPAIDNQTLKEDLKNGEIQGAKLLQTESLRIK